MHSGNRLDFVYIVKIYFSKVSYGESGAWQIAVKPWFWCAHGTAMEKPEMARHKFLYQHCFSLIVFLVCVCVCVCVCVLWFTFYFVCFLFFCVIELVRILRKYQSQKCPNREAFPQVNVLSPSKNSEITCSLICFLAQLCNLKVYPGHVEW
jgi:hypothetical protein